MLDFLPTGTNLTLVGPATTLLEGITVERRREYTGIRFSVAASGDRPARADITEWHLVGYFNKYVAACPSTCLAWKSPYDALVVRDGPYEGLSLTQVEVAGPERDRSKPFPLDWIPQGARFHVQYPDKEEGDSCSFFATGEDGSGFLTAGDPALWSAEKLVALYCERFSIPNTRDPYSVIIWCDGDFEGLSLRASKRRMADNLEARRRAALHLGPPKPAEEPWMKACRENCDRDARYNAAWARAQATVELERKALAEELERKAATAAAEAEEEAREAAADAIFAEEERAALAAGSCRLATLADLAADPWVATNAAASAAIDRMRADATLDVATAQIKAKEAHLLKELERLEGLQTAHQRVKTLESRIAELKAELKIE